jgi:hypothetical protein
MMRGHISPEVYLGHRESIRERLVNNLTGPMIASKDSNVSFLHA